MKKMDIAALVSALRKYRAALLVLLVGVLLMASGGGCEKTTPSDTANSAAARFDLAAFQSDLNDRLAAIEGAGRVSLMLSLEETEETVYAVNVRQSGTEENGGSRESDLAILSSGGYGETPVTVKNKMPAFRGAVVLCDGADDPTVRLAVTRAVSTVCGLGTDKISVLKMAADA